MSATIHMAGRLDPREGWEAEHCPIVAALQELGARSTFVLLREAFYGASRFDDLAHRARISEPVAAARLRELVDRGLLEREDYREPGQRTRQRYLLTEKGADLLPVLAALMQWGDRWLGDGARAVELRHRDCGEPVGVQLRCGAGHLVGEGEVELAVKRRP